MARFKRRIRGMRHIPCVAERDDYLEDLLRALPDAPSDWVSSAAEIPLLMEAAEARDGDDLLSLRRALTAAGLDGDDAHVHALRRVIRRGPAP
jgi:hypothetical protein